MDIARTSGEETNKKKFYYKNCAMTRNSTFYSAPDHHSVGSPAELLKMGPFPTTHVNSFRVWLKQARCRQVGI